MRRLHSRPPSGFMAASLVLLPLLFVFGRGGPGVDPPPTAEPASAAEVDGAAVAEDAPAENAPAARDGAVGSADPGAGADAPAPDPAGAVRRVPDLRPLRRTDERPPAYRPERAAIPVRVGTEVLTRRITAVAVLPGRTLPIHAVGLAGRRADGAEALVLEHADGTAASGGAGQWEWTAPDEPGIHALRIRDPATAREVWIHALVLHPRSDVHNRALNGYAIGRYVERPRDGLDAYVPPEGFVEVGRADRDVLVSPHFTLGQFLCKQPGEPRYVAYSLPLVTKLEAVLEELDRSGRGASTLHVMSGFRTPAYNRAIGNTTVYSRHLWGDAADVWVDADGDGEMDDLNGDGRVDLADARALADVVERVERRGGPGLRPGGIGLYRRNAHHGPFVHVDARGHRARW